MVGEEVVTDINYFNGLQESEGQNGPLTPKGNFERRPHLFELIDKDGNSVATFTPPAMEKMAAYAKALWPDQTQDEERSGRGWDIEVVQPVGARS